MSMVRKKGEEADDLREIVKKNRHTEEELMVANAFIEKESKERKDELREVIVPGEHVKIGHVIGKGGFGVVNVGMYTNKFKGENSGRH